jgi:AAA domain
MLFRRIAVRNFRKLESPIVIDGLKEGVTLIAGDNEEGKSTLLDAIRAGLFERHNSGTAAGAMQPYGSSVRPEIGLDFEIDGKKYSIAKGFAQKPSALLVTPAGKFEGPDAEERLAELLRFKVPQRGKSKQDDQGILGLFWLEQGRALQGLGLVRPGGQRFARPWRPRLAMSLAAPAATDSWKTRKESATSCSRQKRVNPEVSSNTQSTKL